MAAAILTQARLKELLHYDPETGIFTRKIAISRSVKVGDIAGSKSKKGYISIKIDDNSYLAHRLAWFYITGGWPANLIDHLNGVADDNRIANLREATVSQNGQNQRRPMKDNKCGFLGVNFHNGAYRAQIGFNGKYIHLGRFETPERAHEAYLSAKRKLHGYSTI